MIPIHVTKHLLASHEALLPVFERLGKVEYLQREQTRVEALREMLSHQNPKDQKLF